MEGTPFSRSVAYRTTDPRCFEYRGHWYWREGVDRRPEQLYGHQSYVPDRNRDDRYTRDWDQRRGIQTYSQPQWHGQTSGPSGGRDDNGRR